MITLWVTKQDCPWIFGAVSSWAWDYFCTETLANNLSDSLSHHDNHGSCTASQDTVVVFTCNTIGVITTVLGVCFLTLIFLICKIG